MMDMPVRISLDDHQRLHGRPAIAWADGYSVDAEHGNVPL
jgi:hypothetical protein